MTKEAKTIKNKQKAIKNIKTQNKPKEAKRSQKNPK